MKLITHYGTIIVVFGLMGWLLFLYGNLITNFNLKRQIQTLQKKNQSIDNELKFIKRERERMALSALDIEKLLIDKIVVSDVKRKKYFNEAKKEILNTHGIEKNLQKLCLEHSGFSFCDDSGNRSNSNN
jgi:hypothetical protein